MIIEKDEGYRKRKLTIDYCPNVYDGEELLYIELQSVMDNDSNYISIHLTNNDLNKMINYLTSISRNKKLKRILK